MRFIAWPGHMTDCSENQPSRERKESVGLQFAIAGNDAKSIDIRDQFFLRVGGVGSEATGEWDGGVSKRGKTDP